MLTVSRVSAGSGVLESSGVVSVVCAGSVVSAGSDCAGCLAQPVKQAMTMTSARSKQSRVVYFFIVILLSFYKPRGSRAEFQNHSFTAPSVMPCVKYGWING